MNDNTNPQNSDHQDQSPVDDTSPKKKPAPATETETPERDLSEAGVEKSASIALTKAFVIFRVFRAHYAGNIGTVDKRADHYAAMRITLKPRDIQEETYVELMIIGLATKLEAIGAFGMNNAHPTPTDALMREGHRGFWKAHDALERRRRAERAEQAKAERAERKADEQAKKAKGKGHEQEKEKEPEHYEDRILGKLDKEPQSPELTARRARLVAERLAAPPDAWRERIVIDQSVSNRRAVVKGTYESVIRIMRYLAQYNGDKSKVLEEFPEITADDLECCIMCKNEHMEEVYTWPLDSTPLTILEMGEGHWNTRHRTMGANEKSIDPEDYGHVLRCGWPKDWPSWYRPEVPRT